MLNATTTKNNTGVTITGDINDFEKLYEALHTIVGEEGEYKNHYATRIRVMGMCYEIRHALMGHREIVFVDNGMSEQLKYSSSIIGPEKNVYISFNTLWPELIFVHIALNDFIHLYARKIAKSRYDYLNDNKVIWDYSITIVRLLQSTIVNCIKNTVTEASYNRMLKIINQDYTILDNYTHQYLDRLNCKFIEMNPEKRLKNISIQAKRIVEKNDEYCRMRTELKEAAVYYNSTVHDLEFSDEYPDEIVW